MGVLGGGLAAQQDDAKAEAAQPFAHADRSALARPARNASRIGHLIYPTRSKSPTLLAPRHPT